MVDMMEPIQAIMTATMPPPPDWDINFSNISNHDVFVVDSICEIHKNIVSYSYTIY